LPSTHPAYTSTQFQTVPLINIVMVKELVAFATRAINSFPHADGISSSLSPDTIVTRRPKLDYGTLKLEFGQYVQVYDGTSNDTKSRTLGAIALNPTGNSNSDYYFMSLATGCQIHRRSWTILPISDIAISRVEAIALEEGIPLVDNCHMISEYNPDEVVDESSYDKDYALPTNDEPDSDHHLTTDAYTDSEDSSSDDSDDEDLDMNLLTIWIFNSKIKKQRPPVRQPDSQIAFLLHLRVRDCLVYQRAKSVFLNRSR
jgi:hypothetical protein